MLIHPNFDPIAIHLGPLAIRWYGLMYLAGFIMFMWFGRIRLRQPQVAAQGWTARDIDDLLFYGVLGVILGGRLGYVLFYKPSFYLSHPLDIFKVWEGGMAFHGGFLGVVIAMWVFSKVRGRPWMEVTDFIAPMIPCGLAAGRLGNFINGELWGRPTDLPWGMVFPQAGDNIARHPSQLYQFAGEGVALFVILWLFARHPRPMGAVSGAFLLGYGVFRFLAEFAREPDNFLGLLALNFSMGQWLSLPMIVAGAAMMWWAYRRQPQLSA
ncbi:prolipoprotein diacylglyceryl transferase [Cupriavidus gilardii]|uniref:prolipoprotein diacylglyceryl transferase n=1 Tax=Cupriavidus gilardii TaxID=82541 RepID=UPI001ABEAE5D|nr:prolipoprotein diacylglyceryl transferase [Cupriavidus gilardii]MBO4119535.1 prolipoprotein diacylglyceryl transferase [Cupriavidus gilardii]